MVPDDPRWFQIMLNDTRWSQDDRRWSQTGWFQMIPELDDPRWSQMIQDDIRWSQARWSQKIPDEIFFDDFRPTWFQMIHVLIGVLRLSHVLHFRFVLKMAVGFDKWGCCLHLPKTPSIFSKNMILHFSSDVFFNGPIWAQMIPDDPRWSQMIPDDFRWSQMIPDDPRGSQMDQMIPGWAQMISNEMISDVIGPRRSQLIPDIPEDHRWSKTIPDDLRRDDFSRSQAKWSLMISGPNGPRWSKYHLGSYAWVIIFE